MKGTRRKEQERGGGKGKMGKGEFHPIRPSVRHFEWPRLSDYLQRVALIRHNRLFPLKSIVSQWREVEVFAAVEVAGENHRGDDAASHGRVHHAVAAEADGKVKA